MRKIILMTAFFSALISFSCEEDFNPKTEFKQKYVLWCIVNANQNYSSTPQYAVLSKLYNVDGYNPYDNRIDPVLLGADVRLYADNFEYPFIQDTTNRSDTSRYDSTFIYYRTGPVRMKFDTKLKIVAKLPTGEVLSSETGLPQNQGLEFSDYFINGVSTIRNDRADSWDIWWETDGKHLFFPRLRLWYQETEGDGFVTRNVLVSSRYINNEPYYPDYSLEPGVSYSFEAIDSAMAQISSGDPDKSRYTVLNFTFELLEYDAPLSYYYSSINGYLDNYSIRLDELVYSNINGGIGVFGSTLLRYQGFSVSELYAKMFGYN